MTLHYITAVCLSQHIIHIHSILTNLHVIVQEVLEISEEVLARFAVRMEREAYPEHQSMESEHHFDVLFVQNKVADGDGMLEYV